MTGALPLPKPIPDADSAPFWEALKEGRLLIQRCGPCGHAQLYFRAMCRECWSRALSHEQASGLGTVYSVTIVHLPGHAALAADAPYQLALVDLDEGPRVLGRLVGLDTPIGTRVRAGFRAAGQSALLEFETAE